jgi:hypothetical protein
MKNTNIINGIFRVKETERTEQMRVAANHLGLSFIEQTFLPQSLINTNHSIFRHHKNGYTAVNNVIHGHINNVALSIFDYNYRERKIRALDISCNQTIVSLQKDSNHQSIYFRPNRPVEPRGIQTLLAEAYTAYKEELFIEKHRNKARFHLQVEVLSVQDVDAKQPLVPFNVSIKARVVGIFRGDGSLRHGDLVNFNVTAIQPDESPDSIVPKTIKYSSLLEAQYMEVFLNGQPPNCYIPGISELSILKEPAESYFFRLIFSLQQQKTLKFYFNPLQLLGETKPSWRDLFRWKKKKPQTHR